MEPKAGSQVSEIRENAPKLSVPLHDKGAQNRWLARAIEEGSRAVLLTRGGGLTAAAKRVQVSEYLVQMERA